MTGIVSLSITFTNSFSSFSVSCVFCIFVRKLVIPPAISSTCSRSRRLSSCTATVVSNVSLMRDMDSDNSSIFSPKYSMSIRYCCFNSSSTGFPASIASGVSVKTSAFICSPPAFFCQSSIRHKIILANITTPITYKIAKFPFFSGSFLLSLI